MEIPESCKAANEAYKVENNPILQFLEECTVPREQSDSGIFTTTDAMFSAYKTWAALNNCRYTGSRLDFKKTCASGTVIRWKLKTRHAQSADIFLSLQARLIEELGGFL